MDFGMISFIPLGDFKEQRVSGGQNIDGKFEILEPKGPNAGNYRVEIRWQKATGKKVIDRDSGEEFDARVEGLPDKYHKKSELTAEVNPDSTEFYFDTFSE